MERQKTLKPGVAYSCNFFLKLGYSQNVLSLVGFCTGCFYSQNAIWPDKDKKDGKKLGFCSKITIKGQLEKLGLENNSMSHKLVQAGDVLSRN